MRRYKARWRPVCGGSWVGAEPLLRPRPGPFSGEEAQRLQGRQEQELRGELLDLKRQLKDLAAGVLDGSVDRGSAAVANQLLNTVVRVVEQQRKIRETEELAARLEALEEVLKGRRAG